MSQPVLVPRVDMKTQIMALLENNKEGLSMTEIYKRLGCGKNTSNPKVNELITAGKVFQAKVGGYNRCFASESQTDD